jgi:hypothetical protein
MGANANLFFGGITQRIAKAERIWRLVVQAAQGN